MRIVHIITRLIVGGAQENTIATVLGLQARHGADVQLLSGPTSGPEGSLEARFIASNGRFQLCPHLIRAIHPWHDALALRDLKRLLHKLNPAIVHTHSGKAGFIGRLAARMVNTKTLIHGIHGPSFGSFQGPVANAAFLAAERFAAGMTRHFVSVAHAMTDQYLAAGIGQPEQFTRILSGFDLAPFASAAENPAQRNRLGIAGDEIVVGMVARLFKLKGHDDLLDIAPTLLAQNPKLRFLLVGDGAWRARLEERADIACLNGKFHFTGLVPPEEVPSLIGAMDILVHLSRREGLPRALSQGSAAAKPTVAYDCDGAREVCLHHETGLLIPTGDKIKLTESLLALAANRPLRNRLGRSGQERVKAEFGVDRMVDQTWALYKRLSV